MLEVSGKPGSIPRRCTPVRSRTEANAADDLGEGVELIHPHGRLRLHHTEDSERTILQDLALVLHLTEAALQVRHLAADGLQLLLQHCG
jgi:hypothetical protein